LGGFGGSILPDVKREKEKEGNQKITGVSQGSTHQTQWEGFPGGMRSQQHRGGEGGGMDAQYEVVERGEGLDSGSGPRVFLEGYIGLWKAGRGWSSRRGYVTDE